eukprot:757538-Hanusia_phi.AAC.3
MPSAPRPSAPSHLLQPCLPLQPPPLSLSSDLEPPCQAVRNVIGRLGPSAPVIRETPSDFQYLAMNHVQQGAGPWKM